MSGNAEPGAEMTDQAGQAEVVAYLRSGRAFPDGGSHIPVACHETHGALVFAAGEDVYKIKRAVRFPYMDFSTLEQRERVIRREYAINKPHAPDLYLGVVPITREADGTLAVDGGGRPVEWALHMRRFRDCDLMSAVAARGGITREIGAGIADAVAASHARADVVAGGDGAARISRVIEQVISGLEAARADLGAEQVSRFAMSSRAELARVAGVLDRRAAAGRVRRCHGDLHLGNIVLWRGQPVLFDALEFDERLASIDTLYDTAFLLMDLDAAGRRATANLVLNRLLAGPRDAVDLDGLSALPSFLALRAAVRAMVGADRAAQEAGSERAADLGRASDYLEQALRYLEPKPARLVAVGGFSGTGKSTLAAALAPELGAAPGALHIRADVERKAMFGLSELQRLPADAYTAEAGARVYSGMMDKARRVLSAGHAVVVDAVFSRPGERAAVEAAARDAGTAFAGLWLTARRDVLMERVAARTADASDATTDVVAAQMERGAGEVMWTRLDAGGGAAATLAAARRALGLDP